MFIYKYDNEVEWPVNLFVILAPFPVHKMSFNELPDEDKVEDTMEKLSTTKRLSIHTGLIIKQCT